MKNIFNQLDANAPEHRNAYDLSQRHLYSLKVGQKMPIMCIETLPKDFFEVDCLSLVRSMPINTAAFSRLKCTFDFIFVPYQQLWHGWNQFFLQNEENMSTGDSFEHESLPRFDLISILKELILCHDFYNFYLHLIDYYKSHSWKLPKNLIEQGNAGIFDFCGYNFCIDVFGYSFGYNAIRLLDMLGYGSFYNMLANASQYDVLTDEIVSESGISSSHTFQDNLNAILGIVSNIGSSRILPAGFPVPYSAIDSATYYGWAYKPQGSGSVLRNLYVNPFRLLAYQKAWQDYTMNKRVQSYNPAAFNVDAHTVIEYLEDCWQFFVLRYDNWDYDMFTGGFTSPQSGDVSLMSGTASILFKNADGSPATSSAAYNLNGKLSDAISANNHYTSILGPSVYDIKRAEFMQRWKENHLRAGHKGQNQALGQWNTRFRYLSDEYSDFITSFDMVINIDEVINTADNQGDISGKGIGTSNGRFKYEANDAGVIICLLSVKPRAEYDATMIDKQNICLEPFDFPSPFFDNLGLEVVPSYLLNLQHDRVGAGAINYNIRYLPWKSAVDKVHGNMMSSYFTKDNDAGSLSIWATPRRELANADYSNDIDTLFYVSPSIVDTIFASFSDYSIESDHFIFNTNFMVRVVRNLSISGMPNWNV